MSRRGKKPSKASELARVHGLHAAEAVLRGRPQAVVRIYAQDSRQDERLGSVLSIAENLGLVIERCAPEQLDKLSF
ncbi:MAG: RNA methyltransferase substrate-binding domain-containing protein, partial [Granulosicoccaceae bacterium]